MEQFVLVPAKLRAGRLVARRGEESLHLDWPGLRDRLSPNRTKMGMRLLRQLHAGSFVGTRRRGSQVATFLYNAAGRSRNISSVLRADPSFETNLVEVFYVDKAQWDGGVTEA